MTLPEVLHREWAIVMSVREGLRTCDALELWQTWGRPEIWRLPHGHIGIGSQLIPGLRGRVLRWLATRLNVPRSFTDTK